MFILRSAVCATVGSLSSHQMNNTKNGSLLTNTIDHQLTTSDIPSRHINTPTNRRINTYLSSTSQTASADQLLSSINYITSNTPSRHINTPTNRHVNTNPSSSQTASGSQPLSTINYTTNNNAILETFAEYRGLKRELQQALKLKETWKSDYQILVNRMQRLEKSSFRKCFVFSYHFLFCFFSTS